MALINCGECGKKFSDKAVACPNCGCPTKEAISTLSENAVAAQASAPVATQEEVNKDLRLTPEQDAVMRKVVRLNFRIETTELLGNLLATVCGISLIVSPFFINPSSGNNWERLLFFTAWPLMITCMSLVRRGGSFFFVISPALAIALFRSVFQAPWEFIWAMIGAAAAYHLTYNELPSKRLQLESIHNSPEYIASLTKIMEWKRLKGDNQS